MPPFAASTNPGNKSVKVTCWNFIVLPQAASSGPDFENSPNAIADVRIDA
jgi:hypothetical protein